MTILPLAVDITLLFRASVKTVKRQNKALGVAVGGGIDGNWDELFHRSPWPKGNFSSWAREVISHIGKLRDFLLEHRKDYISAYNQIDQDVHIFMRTCSEEIHSRQVKEHRTAVLDFIEDYLKKECVNFTQNKEPSKLKEKFHSVLQKTEENPATEEHPEKILTETQPELGTWGDGKGEDELSPEEIQMFEQENQRLIGEMNSLFDEVRQIEGRVVEISRLQEIFTEKVLQQEAEIDSLHQFVVGGNEDIREAIKNNAGFRVWILFFLVMCSFSLLFLDCYHS
uniref:Syntaxin-18 n=1 Tax=Nomascus leucogenys TaxID=61853 RepID=A0A2I3G7C1_NOMLE